MELLAPAGTMENFIAALESGADAIILVALKPLPPRCHLSWWQRF